MKFPAFSVRSKSKYSITAGEKNVKTHLTKLFPTSLLTQFVGIHNFLVPLVDLSASFISQLFLKISLLDVRSFSSYLS